MQHGQTERVRKASPIRAGERLLQRRGGNKARKLLDWLQFIGLPYLGTLVGCW